MTQERWPIVMFGILAVCGGGCGSIGPQTVHRDQYAYNVAISKAQNEQMLLNLAQIRYGESPMFLRIASIVNSYSLEEQLSGVANWSEGLLSSNYQNISPLVKYTDRPTITYTPLLGEQFAKSLLVPIQDVVIVSFINFGWSVKWVFRLCVSSINDVDNKGVRATQLKQADDRFELLIGAFHRLQEAKALHIRAQHDDGIIVEFISFENRMGAPAIDRDIALVKELLQLKPDVLEYRVGRSPGGSPDTEILIRGRSLYELMEVISAEINVPQEDVDMKRVLPSPDSGSPADGGGPLIRIYSSAEKPSNAYVAVHYRNTWFWIDDSDYPSKKLFSIVIGLFMITESGTKDFAPVLTIPAG